MLAHLKKHGYIFWFHASILNQRGPNRYVLRLIQWQNLKRKIVAVSFFWTTNNFEDKFKISDSVDFEQSYKGSGKKNVKKRSG